ncbi:hypothetical protein D3C81_1300770 [compost metagenome]
MPEQAAYVPPAHLGRLRPAILVVEEVLVAAPEALVAMHAARVVGKQGLGHECGDLAVAACNILADVLVHHHVVRHSGQRCKAHVDLILARRGYLMVMDLDPDASLHQREYDFGADILQRIAWRHGKVSALVVLLVAKIAAAIGAFVTARGPFAFGGFDMVVAGVLVLPEANGVENEEFQFGANVANRGKTGLLEIPLRLSCDVARIA